MSKTPKKILVVDDDFYQRDLYQQIFTEHGFDAIPANDGQDAWKKLEKTKVDLLFTGIDMPHMDGFTLLKKFREKKENSHTPVVIFSHLGRPEDRMKAKAFMNVYFMVKGYDKLADILKKVENLLNYKEGSDTVPPPEEDDRVGSTMI
jgi:DNA-binding response OmpR family regulator